MPRLTHKPHFWLALICSAYASGAVVFGSLTLDIDEFAFIREPYEMVGGDYTISYLKENDYVRALKCAAKSYFFFWNYRPLFSPIIHPKDKGVFREEEIRFSYSPPSDAEPRSLEHYQKRLIVPEPDRFFTHGAGKPLLPALLSLPQLALVHLATIDGPSLLELQLTRNYHPLFVLTRLVQMLAGLVSVLLVYAVCRQRMAEQKALLATAFYALLPMNIKYFPNLHHDSILVPFLIASTYFLLKKRLVISALCYGFALASKNTALFFLPFLLTLSLSGHSCQSVKPGRPALARSFFKRLGHPAMFAALAFVTLVPFANPISYCREVLTPVFGRDYDPRGEDVSSFSFHSRSMLSAKAKPNMSYVRPELLLVKRLFRLDSSFVFVVLSLFLSSKMKSDRFTRTLLYSLLLLLPFGVVFGYTLTYRYLMILPFFVMVAADFATEKTLVAATILTGIYALLFLLDPINTDNIHIIRAGI